MPGPIENTFFKARLDISEVKDILLNVLPKLAETSGKKLSDIIKRSIKIEPIQISVDQKKALEQINSFTDTMRTFWSKVQHYLEFTIGVQLVLRSARALQQSIDLFTEFEKKTVMAASVSGYFGKAFSVAAETIAKFARNIGKETAYSAVETAEAMYSIASAGYDVTEFGKDELLPILNYATAQGIELNDAVDQIVRTFKEFKSQGETTASIVDKFTAAITSSFLNAQRLAEGMKYVGAMAGSVGVSLDETVAALATLVDRGYEGSQAGQSLNMVLAKLLKPAREGEKALARLGLTLADIDPRAHSLTEILYTLRSAGFSATEAAEMFRARTAAAALTLIENADAVAMFAGKLSAVQGITQELAEKQMNTLWGALKHLRNVLVDVGIEIGRTLAPAILGFGDAIENYILPIMHLLLAPIRNLVYIFTGFGTATRQTISFFISLGATIAGFLITLKILGTLLKIIPVSFYSSAVSAQTFASSLSAVGNIAAYAVNKLTGLVISTDALKQGFAALLLTSSAIFGSLYFQLPAGISETIVSFTSLYIILGTLRNRILSTKDALTLLATTAITAISVGLAQSADTFEHKLIPGLLATASATLNAAIMFKLLGLSLTSMTSIIGIALMAVITLVSLFKDEIAAGLKSLGQMLGLVPTEAEEIARKLPQATEAINNMTNAIKNWTETTKEIAAVREQMNAVEASAEDIASMTDHLNNLLDIQSENYLNIAKSFEQLLSISANMTPSIGELVKVTRDYISAENEKSKLQEKSIELERQRKNAYNDMIKAIAIYGKDSDQAAEATNKYNEISEEYNKTISDISESENKISTALEKKAEIIGKMTAAEKEYSEYLWNTADSYITIIRNIERLNKLYTNLNSLEYIRKNINKILNEQFADLADSESKIYDIEEKLYKLRHGIVDEARDLWDQLAKEGLITDDLIEDRKDLEKSYGEMMKSQVAFANLLDRLLPDQRKKLIEWVETYVNALEAGTTPPKAPTFLTGKEVDIAKAYAESIYQYGVATKKLKSDLETFVSSFIEANIASSNLADKYYELIDTVADIRAAEQRLREELENQPEVFSSIVETIWNYWRSIYQSSEETSNMQGAFIEAARGLGIFTDALENADIMLGYIRMALGDQTITWDTLTEEQAVAALTIGKVGDAYLGLYRAMTMNDIRSLIPGADSWDGFIAAINKVKDTALPTIQSLYAEIEKVRKSFDSLPKQVNVNVNTKTTQPSITEVVKEGIIQGIGAAIPPVGLAYGIYNLIKRIRGGQYGGLVRKPTLLLAGEAGPELLLPLTNKARTLKLLGTFLPRYLPELTGQHGGFFGRYIPVTTSNDRYETINVTGPIYVQGVRNVEEFMNELKYRARAASPL